MKTPTTILFHDNRPEIHVRVTATINLEGDLMIEGYDSGKLVEELKGNWDYEYNMVIKKSQKEQLLNKLADQLQHDLNDEGLLKWLKENYNHNEAFSALQFLFDRLNVPYEPFYWT